MALRHANGGRLAWTPPQPEPEPPCEWCAWLLLAAAAVAVFGASVYVAAVVPL